MAKLSDELIQKRCVFNLDCDVNYSFHYAVVAHIEKVHNHKKVHNVAQFPNGGFFLSNPVNGGSCRS